MKAILSLLYIFILQTCSATASFAQTEPVDSYCQDHCLSVPQSKISWNGSGTVTCAPIGFFNACGNNDGCGKLFIYVDLHLVITGNVTAISVDLSSIGLTSATFVPPDPSWVIPMFSYTSPAKDTYLYAVRVPASSFVKLFIQEATTGKKFPTGSVYIPLKGYIKIR